MKKKILSALLIFALLGSTVCSVAAGTRASLYLDGYSISLNAKGGGKMAIGYTVLGTRTMDVIGARSISVEEWNGSGWEETMTYSVAKNPDFYAYNESEHFGTVYFYGLPNVKYRATMTAYASLNGGFDTGTITSSGTSCK